METGEIFVSAKDGVHVVRVTGNASFACAPSLRLLAQSLDKEPFKGIVVDLKECIWMDSTFMGVLAMLGLRAKKAGVPAEIYNASEQNEGLLCGLGLKKIFQFKTGDRGDQGVAMEQAPATPENSARTVLEAHETLMNVDDANKKLFGAVVDMVRKDVNRMEREGKKPN